MANEISLVNGVTKAEIDGTGEFLYFFPKATFRVTPNGTADLGTYKQIIANGQQIRAVAFGDITAKLAAVEIVGYMDAVATAGYFL